MTDIKSSHSQLTALATNSYQIQLFMEEFEHNPSNSKTFNIIQENFIKKFRYKNALPGTPNHLRSLTQFVQNYRETLKYYDNYHEYLESTLDKYPFCRDFKKFYKDLHKSEQKTLSFFIEEIEFHKAFMQANEVKYEQKMSEIKEVCINCKENYNQKFFENIKQNVLHFIQNQVVYPFTDPFELYSKKSSSYGNDKRAKMLFQRLQSQRAQTNEGENLFKAGLDQIYSAEQKMRSLIKQSKSISGNALEQIFDMFEHRQEVQVESVNKVRINQMFYDLQNDLNLRCNYIEEYIEELMGFNDRLINYNPNTAVKGDPNEDIVPDVVDKELKGNFQKVVKKIYKKVLELIQKRKDESISVECQANFSHEAALRELEKQKKKLNMELKQCQQEKKTQVNNLRHQNQRLTKDLKDINEEKVKAQIAKQQAQTQKNNAQKNADKLIKVVAQMKKEIEKLTYVVQKEKRGSRLGKTDLRPVENKQSKFSQDKSKPKEKSKQKQKQKNVQKEEVEIKINVINNETTEKSDDGRDVETPDDPLDANQLELLHNLANKQIKNRKIFIQPRRSKLLDTLTVEENALSREIKRISKRKEEEERLSSMEDENQSRRSSHQKSHASSINELTEIQETVNGEKTSKRLSQKTKLTIKSKINGDANKLNPPKNYKSKTYSQLFKKGQQEIKQLGKSSKDISQSSEEVKKQYEDLQKIQKMKQIEVKLASITRKSKMNEPRTSKLGINDKQIQLSLLSPNARDASSKGKIKNVSSIHSIQKSDLIKRFGKPSVSRIDNQSEGRLSTKQIISQAQEPRRSNVSIQSQNYMNMCDEIYKELEEKLVHVGIQASANYDSLFRQLFEMELRNRKFNEMILDFESFKFGYEEFLTQLMAIVLKQEANPIRKLNSYKGSSSVLKKNHNYRFNKENLRNRTWKEEDDSQQTFENTMSKAFSRTVDERNYFVPKNGSEEKKPAQNQTVSNFAFFNRRSMNDASYNFLNCVTISDFKNLARRNQSFKEVTATDTGIRKKGCYTLHNVRTDGTEGISEEEHEVIKEQESEKNQMPMEEKELPRLPSFQREDAENLFFSIESARVFEQNIEHQGTGLLPMMALEQHEIKLSTEILTTLAHIHLVQPAIYLQIKTLLLFPVKVMSSNNSEIEGEQNGEIQAELSLKKGLGFIIQLHRKCQTRTGTAGQENVRKNGKTSQQSRKKGSCPCIHLVNFKEKIFDVIRTQNAIKSAANAVNQPHASLQ